MVRNRRPVRGGKRKHERSNERRVKPKRGKFKLREANYVKERDAKNEEIEKRRKILEEERAKERELQTDSSDEESVNPLQTLLSTFSEKKPIKPAAIESSSESDQEEDVLAQEEDDSEDQGNDRSESDQEEDVLVEEEDDSEDGDRSESGRDPEEDSRGSVSEGEETERDRETSDTERKAGGTAELKEDDEEDEETAKEDAGHLEDPFSIHLTNDLDDALYEAVSSTPQICTTQKLSWPTLGNLVCQIPKAEHREDNKKTARVSILEEKRFAKPGTVPCPIETLDFDKLNIKSQIRPNLTVPLTPLQRELFSVVNNYQDLYYPERTFSNADQIRFVYCLHAINHALKTRTKILHHNAKIAKLKSTNIADMPEEYRDHGLVRPKILILVPFRHSCLKVVEHLISILIGEDKGGSVVNKNRFMEDFGGNELSMPKKNPKPEDYEQTFQGNTDDTFKIGLSITKKTLKLYTEFYSSDIIISSILGLRMLIGAEGDPERDYDFLASVELLIMDQAELFLMQNWDHALHVLDHLHLQPKDFHGTDFSRVRSWCVNGWAKYYRQTLIFSGVQAPEILGAFNKKCHNYAGKVKIVNPVSSGSVCQVVVQVPQVFHRFDCSSHSQALESRLDFFVGKILPQYKDRIMNHTLIFVPSYFDFVKLRNYLKREEYSFVQVCEYSKDAKVARARDMFFHSDAHFLLYSERFHFFRRIRVKGIRHIIFYAPPVFPQFYSEMCNLMQQANQNPKAGSDSNMTVTTLYTRYDVMRLSAIVGTERAGKMIASEKSVHMLITGEQ